MSQIKMDSEDIAEIKNALCIIQGNAELMRGYTKDEDRPEEIIKQVKRIDKLLPKVAFEGGNNASNKRKSRVRHLPILRVARY